MKVAVLGHKGMLGEAVVTRVLEHGYDLCTTNDKIIDKLDVQKLTDGCDVAINCAGKIPIRCQNDLSMIHSNAIVPHLLAQNFKGRIIHVSTDKVFSGRDWPGVYTINSTPNPIGLYGCSKLLGEVQASNVVNVRTSFIGYKHGLLAWLLAHKDGVVDGYMSAIWSGSTVHEVATWLLSMCEYPLDVNTVHLTTQWPISKFELIKYLSDRLQLNIRINPVDEPIQNFTLKPTICLLPVTDGALL